MRSVNQHEYVIKQHSLQLLPPGTIHSFEDTHERSEYYVLLFEKSYIDMNELMDFHDSNFDAVELSKNHFNKVKELYEEIDTELKSKNDNFMTYVRILLGQILLILQREKLQAIVSVKQSKSDLICSQFLGLVEENFSKFKTISEYAQIIELTPKHLSETIKEKLGNSALHFIHKRVIKEAEYLLVYTQMSIYAIATSLNFQDASQFSRFFKQHKGLSPKNYRLNFQIIH
jgi:AraC family transcriptional activator of pobA